jgi:hypothetical protein
MSDPASAMQRWEQRIEAALDPGRYVSDRGCFAFVGDLEEVAAGLGGPGRAGGVDIGRLPHPRHPADRPGPG